MAERTLPGLGLTGFWDLGANEWNEEMDLNLLTLSAVAQLSVISTTTALPGSPTDGDIYIVPDGANANKVAVRDDGAWVFLTPAEGWRAWARDTDRLVVFDGAAWSEISGNPDAEFDSVGVNATADSEHLLAVNSPAVLFNRETDDITLKLNKEATGDDAAVSLSTDWAVKALLGLLGSDAFTISVSPDGSTYHRGIVIDQNTGHVGINDATPDSNNALAVKGSSVLFSNEGDDMVLTVNKDAVGDDAAMTFQTNYSGRALIGLLGSDDFVFTVSPDGSTYTQALIIDKDDATVSFPQQPKFSAYLNFGQNYPASGWQDMLMNITRHNDQGALVINSNIATFTAPHDGYYLFGLGATYATTGSGTPDRMAVGLGINGQPPTDDNRGSVSNLVSLGSSATMTALLKLSEGDTVSPKIVFITATGRVADGQNFFWGHQVS